MRFRKLRFFSVFVVAFVLIFAVLNGRFLAAEVQYSLGMTPTISPVVSPVPGNPPILEKTAIKTSDNAVLTIGKIGVSAPIVFGVSDKTKDIYDNLSRGVVHYSPSPKPGEKGASIILGHSSDYPWKKNAYGAVFALLGKLTPGDRLQVQYDNGTVLTFEVRQSLIFTPFSKDSRLEKIEGGMDSSLVLVSCWPVGTAYKRIAVEATLVR